MFEGELNVGERRQTESERKVLAAIRSQLRESEFIIEHVRFSDVQSGDVECDVLVFCPGLGIAALEIKGGVVQYVNGEWLVETARGSRRTNPVEQARKAKHALRRYLDRQPEWNHGLVRSEWMVAMPFTEVDSDMGTEGRRDLLIDSRDLDTVMERVRSALDSVFHSEQRPTEQELLLARDLILRNNFGISRAALIVRSEVRKGVLTLSSISFISAAGISGLLNEATSSQVWLTAIVMAPVGAFIAAIVSTDRETFRRRLIAGAIAALIGGFLGGYLIDPALEKASAIISSTHAHL
ncbi:MAG: hypothetical protein RL410_605 [Actinomycetota bacterium]|jgi:hypothetical protein